MAQYLNPFPQHFDSDGNPNAFYVVYFGLPNQDPIANPKVPFADKTFQNALDATQTLNSTGAYAQDIFLDGAYSIRIETPQGSLWRETPCFTAEGAQELVDTVADMVARSFISGDFVQTKGRFTEGDNDTAQYLIKTASQAAADGDVIDEERNFTIANGNVAIVQDQNRLFYPTTTAITVGGAGDYATINEAIAFLSDRRARYVEGQSTSPATINLLTGFIMAEQVFVVGMNLGWITITSVDAEVTIARSALVDSIGNVDASRPAFGGISCTMPTIDALFTMDSSGAVLTRRDGYYVENSKGLVKAGGGFKNCGEVGIYSNDCSEIAAQGTICSGCNLYGYFAFKASRINVEDAVANNCVEYGLYVNRSSHASANNAVFNDCGINAVRCIRGSTVSWEDGIGLRSGAVGLFVLNSKVTAIRADLSNSTDEAIFCHFGSEVAFDAGVAVACGGAGSLLAFSCGVIDAGGATVTGSLATTAAVLSQRGSTINFQNGDASGSTGSFGIRCSEGSTINAVSANAQKGGSPDTSDCSISLGGIISFHSGTGGSVAVNTLTTLGIVFQ